jgi:hypothetical protein
VDRYSAYLLTSGTFAIVLFSIWQGAHTVDPHHWGLMLSNAKDLYDGKIPYQQIFIQYGILTTLLQSLAYGIGQNMLSLIACTAIMYAIGVLFIYVIALHTIKDKKTALYVFVSLVFFHPLAIYPWSNYIAFPFLMAGLYFSVTTCQEKHLPLKASLLGISYGLAVLSREGLMPAVFLFLIISFALDLIYQNRKKIVLSNYLFAITGFLLPLGLFMAYLYSHNLFGYWSSLLINLPGIYIDESFNSQSSFVLKTLFTSIYVGYRYLDIRWIFTSLSIFSCIWAIVFFVFKKKAQPIPKKYVIITLVIFTFACVSVQLLETFKISSRDQVWLSAAFILFLGAVIVCLAYVVNNRLPNYSVNIQIVKIAFLSLLLLSSSLHLSEIFRIATGSIVGIIVLFAYLDSRGFAKPFFIVMATWLAVTSTYGNRGNYFLPTWEGIVNSKYVVAPQILSGQLWSIDTISYYQDLQKIFQEIRLLPCGIQYQKNNTKDPLLKVLSPFEQLQLAPFQVSDRMSALRPDLDAQLFISHANGIMVLENFKMNYVIDQNDLPKGFVLYTELPIPHQFFMPQNQKLLIFIPSQCIHH